MAIASTAHTHTKISFVRPDYVAQLMNATELQFTLNIYHIKNTTEIKVYEHNMLYF